MRMIVIGHPVEHAMVGPVYVPDTEKQSDAQVRARIGLHAHRVGEAPVQRRRYCVSCRQPSPCTVRRGARL